MDRSPHRGARGPAVGPTHNCCTHLARPRHADGTLHPAQAPPQGGGTTVKLGIPREVYPGERRVAMAPAAVAAAKKAGFEILVESGAGSAAGFPDADYSAAGCAVVGARAEVFAQSDAVAMVRSLGADPASWATDSALVRPGQMLVGHLEPLSEASAAALAAPSGVRAFALELLPRITRAQTMDVLSSQASLAGYKAVLMAANHLPKLFPMMMTAAGTITPSKVFVVGAGVAGLQAIATAKRLGAIVTAYDVRAAVKEQVESLGAKFLELPMETADGQGGYAKAMDEAFYRRQAELMAGVVADMDVVVTTAAVPGRTAPVLISRDMVLAMRPGSVIVDLAAERGGNCEATVAGQSVECGGATVIGPLNVPASLPFHSSQLYARNVLAFLTHIKGLNAESFGGDEIAQGTLVIDQGEVVHPLVRERLGLEPRAAAEQA